MLTHNKDSDINNKEDIEEKYKELLDLIYDCDVKILIAERLCDGKWHSTSELWRIGKQADQMLGLIKTGIILKSFQDILGEDFVQKSSNNADDVVSWRINPEYLQVFEDIVKKAVARRHRETKSLSSLGLL
ncbi:MAG: hypothetical protein ACTSYN_04850 [Candidatus Heimdallarchaeaceae archaeon]